jgi:hypothetical protein
MSIIVAPDRTAEQAPFSILMETPRFGGTGARYPSTSHVSDGIEGPITDSLFAAGLRSKLASGQCVS